MTMKRVLESLAALGLTAATLAPVAASAQTYIDIPTIPVWSQVDQDGVLNNFYDDVWVATRNEQVLVTDYAVVGDNYKIYDDGILVATTGVADWSISDPTNAHYTSDSNVAWKDPLFAHASFFANAGDQITIYATSVPSTYSDGTVSVSSVPEPATWAMMMLGFAGLSFAAYRKARPTAAVA